MSTTTKNGMSTATSETVYGLERDAKIHDSMAEFYEHKARHHRRMARTARSAAEYIINAYSTKPQARAEPPYDLAYEQNRGRQ